MLNICFSFLQSKNTLINWQLIVSLIVAEITQLQNVD